MQTTRVNEKICQKLPNHIVCLSSEIQIEQRQVAVDYIASFENKFR